MDARMMHMGGSTRNVPGSGLYSLRKGERLLDWNKVKQPKVF
jgi:hypothetical protein